MALWEQPAVAAFGGSPGAGRDRALLATYRGAGRGYTSQVAAVVALPGSRAAGGLPAGSRPAPVGLFGREKNVVPPEPAPTGCLPHLGGPVRAASPFVGSRDEQEPRSDRTSGDIGLQAGSRSTRPGRPVLPAGSRALLRPVSGRPLRDPDSVEISSAVVRGCSSNRHRLAPPVRAKGSDPSGTRMTASSSTMRHSTASRLLHRRSSAALARPWSSSLT